MPWHSVLVRAEYSIVLHFVLRVPLHVFIVVAIV